MSAFTENVPCAMAVSSEPARSPSLGAHASEARVGHGTERRAGWATHGRWFCMGVVSGGQSRSGGTAVGQGRQKCGLTTVEVRVRSEQILGGRGPGLVDGLECERKERNQGGSPCGRKCWSAGERSRFRGHKAKGSASAPSARPIRGPG